MASAGLMRIAAPRAYQGSYSAPRSQVEAIELVSEADGAAGWNLMIGVESFGLMALTFEAGSELFRRSRHDHLQLDCSSRRR